MADEMGEEQGRASYAGSEAAALAAALADPANPNARDYLRAQTRLADLQSEELLREDRVRHWSLRVRHVSDVMKLAFELALALIFTAIVALIAGAVWSAARDNSLVIEAFNVPKDMEERGLNGQAVAAQMQDKLSAMQNATDSARPAASYANNWGNDIKVEIPNTGISIGEFYRYLAKWLGHQTHITGEVFRTEIGIAVTARTGDDAATVTGKASDLDKLLQQAAEKIYERTQPYRYAVFLRQGDRLQIDRAVALLQKLAAEGSPTDRVWAHIGLSAAYARSDPLRTPVEAREAAALDPDSAVAQSDIYLGEATLDHQEAALAAARAAVDLLRSANGKITERARIIDELANKANVAGALGDFAAALGYSQQAVLATDYAGTVDSSRQQISLDLGLLHETTTARTAWGAIPAPASREFRAYRVLTEIELPYWTGDWQGVLAKRPVVERAVEAAIGSGGLTNAWADVALSRGVWPYVATAMAMTADFKGAHALIDQTPLDCYICLRSRAAIDAAGKNWSGADYWFARAVRAAPSVPFAYADWGAMLLAKGDYDGAIAKFTLANQKGPHFADSLEMWGEALMRKNRSDLALAKFEEANNYAPDWGRLHLKWGEALLWSGDKTGAKRQFSIASGLDLSSADRAGLVRMEVPHG